MNWKVGSASLQNGELSLAKLTLLFKEEHFVQAQLSQFGRTHELHLQDRPIQPQPGSSNRSVNSLSAFLITS